MKILHVNDHYTERGGVEQYLLSVGKLLEANGHENVVVYRHKTATTIVDGAWQAYHVSDANGACPSKRLQEVFARERPDVAYIHHVASPEFVSAIAGALPAVAYVHGFSAVCPGLAKYFRRGDTVCTHPFGWGCVPMHYLRRCSAARRPSTLLRLLENTGQLREALLHVPRLLVATPYMQALLVQNGFPAHRIGTLPPHFFGEGDLPPYLPPEQPKLLLFAGRLEIEKGLPYLLQALAETPDDVQLAVAGEGSLRGEYEKLAVELGIAERVAWLGWLNAEEMSAWYSRCAAVVIPSVCPEAFGKSGVEALANGRPVIAFDVGGISDWLSHGVNGYLVSPTDSSDLARAITQLLDDPNQGEAMGRAGQSFAGGRYRADEHLTALSQVFQEAMHGNAG